MSEQQESGDRIQKPEGEGGNQVHRFSFLLTPDFWLLTSVLSSSFIVPRSSFRYRAGSATRPRQASGRTGRSTVNACALAVGGEADYQSHGQRGFTAITLLL